MTFLEKVESRQAVVGVIGLGYVGLPLAVAFAEAGLRVVGIDTDEARVANVQGGHSYVPDVASARLASLVDGDGRPQSGDSSPPATGLLFATSDYDMLSDVDAAIICVPTPLHESREPDISHVVAATEEIAQRLHRDMLIVLESTVYPSITEEFIAPRLEGAGTNGSGLTVGRDFFLAYSPERVDPGRTDWTLRTIPKIVGGVTPHCLEAALALYQMAIEHLVPVSSPQVAEMAKLFENTFRAANIALVNELAIMCDRMGLDVWEVIEAAKTKPFGFMPFYPGPGVGGHCLPVNPHYLSWRLKDLNYHARFVELAAEINSAMPEYVQGKIAEALEEYGKRLNDARVLLLGVAYKADVDDLRESPALRLMNLLRGSGAEVAYHDPHVARLVSDDAAMVSVPLERESLQWADCVVITTPHSAYDWQWVVDNSRLVVDTRNATKDVTVDHSRLVKLSGKQPHPKRPAR